MGRFDSSQHVVLQVVETGVVDERFDERISRRKTRVVGQVRRNLGSAMDSGIGYYVQVNLITSYSSPC